MQLKCEGGLFFVTTVDACRAPRGPFDASTFHINIAEGRTESAGKPPTRRAVPPDLEYACAETYN